MVIDILKLLPGMSLYPLVVKWMVDFPLAEGRPLESMGSSRLRVLPSSEHLLATPFFVAVEVAFFAIFLLCITNVVNVVCWFIFHILQKVRCIMLVFISNEMNERP